MEQQHTMVQLETACLVLLLMIQTPMRGTSGVAGVHGTWDHVALDRVQMAQTMSKAQAPSHFAAQTDPHGEAPPRTGLCIELAEKQDIDIDARSCNTQDESRLY
jgi:hypothetical protein